MNNKEVTSLAAISGGGSGTCTVRNVNSPLANCMASVRPSFSRSANGFRFDFAFTAVVPSLFLLRKVENRRVGQSQRSPTNGISDDHFTFSFRCVFPESHETGAMSETGLRLGATLLDKRG
jgi:hypothetical protein